MLQVLGKAKPKIKGGGSGRLLKETEVQESRLQVNLPFRSQRGISCWEELENSRCTAPHPLPKTASASQGACVL